MQNCVFNPTNVLIYGHPIIYVLFLKGDLVSFGEQNLKKYQEESTKVSSVSVSLVAFFPVFLKSFFPSHMSI